MIPFHSSFFSRFLPRPQKQPETASNSRSRRSLKTAAGAAGVDAIPLTALSEDEQGLVAGIKSPDPAVLKKLMIMGILPGVLIQLRQKKPAMVLDIGYTRLAVDEIIAAAIWINKI
ncbi:MAG: FeoA family protein [Bacillota bacterium]